MDRFEKSPSGTNRDERAAMPAALSSRSATGLLVDRVHVPEESENQHDAANRLTNRFRRNAASVEHGYGAENRNDPRGQNRIPLHQHQQDERHQHEDTAHVLRHFHSPVQFCEVFSKQRRASVFEVELRLLVNLGEEFYLLFSVGSLWIHSAV
jgi:hypothetical protein